MSENACIIGCACIIEELLRQSCASRTFEKKTEIIDNGRPKSFISLRGGSSDRRWKNRFFLHIINLYAVFRKLQRFKANRATVVTNPFPQGEIGSKTLKAFFVDMICFSARDIVSREPLIGFTWNFKVMCKI